MRQKWPVRAAVAREVCVATEMTSDLEGPLGVRELSCCCYGDHVAGPGCQRDSARAGPASASIAARAWGPRAQHPRRAFSPGVPGRRAEEELGSSPQVAASTRAPSRTERGEEWAGLEEDSVLTALRTEREDAHVWAQFSLPAFGRPWLAAELCGLQSSGFNDSDLRCAPPLIVKASVTFHPVWTGSELPPPPFHPSPYVSLLDFVEYKLHSKIRLSEMEDYLRGHE